MRPPSNPVYLDYNATTPVDPRVVEAMVPYLFDRFGNASSAHVYGYEAHDAVDHARDQVAELLQASPQEIVFTGSGSESDNLAIQGVVFAHLDRHPHVITSAIEHPAVLNTLAYLHRRLQVDVTVVPVDHDGMVDPERIAAAIKPETVLVSVMHANNEVGTIQPVQEIARLARQAGVPLHVDGAQSVGKIDTFVDDLGVDLFSLAGHKLYGPKGIGALYVRKGTQIDPLTHGSSQEHGLRAGTENVASIVGLGTACEIVAHAAKEERVRLRSLRDALHRRLEERIPGLLLNGHPQQRLPNTLNVSVPGVSGQETLAYASEVAASTGAACHSGSTEPSSVLVSMGFSHERALGAMRLSLGRWSTPEDVERAASSLAKGYEAARAMQDSLEVPSGS